MKISTSVSASVAESIPEAGVGPLALAGGADCSGAEAAANKPNNKNIAPNMIRPVATRLRLVMLAVVLNYRKTDILKYLRFRYVLGPRFSRKRDFIM